MGVLSNPTTVQSRLSNPRAEDPLWKLLDGGPRDERVAADVYSALQRLLFGN